MPLRSSSRIFPISFQHFLRRDINSVTVEGDAAKPAIPAAAVPIDVDSIPVDDLPHRLLFDINQVNTAVTLALMAASHNRACNKPDIFFNGG